MRKFLREHRVLTEDGAAVLDLSGVPAGRELSIVLGRFQHSDPAHGQDASWHCGRRPVPAATGDALRHLMGALRDLLDDGRGELDGFAAELPQLMDKTGQRNWSGGPEPDPRGGVRGLGRLKRGPLPDGGDGGPAGGTTWSAHWRQAGCPPGTGWGSGVSRSACVAAPATTSARRSTRYSGSGPQQARMSWPDSGAAAPESLVTSRVPGRPGSTAPLT